MTSEGHGTSLGLENVLYIKPACTPFTGVPRFLKTGGFICQERIAHRSWYFDKIILYLRAWDQYAHTCHELSLQGQLYLQVDKVLFETEQEETLISSWPSTRGERHILSCNIAWAKPQLTSQIWSVWAYPLYASRHELPKSRSRYAIHNGTLVTACSIWLAGSHVHLLKLNWSSRMTCDSANSYNTQHHELERCLAREDALPVTGASQNVEFFSESYKQSSLPISFHFLSRMSNTNSQTDGSVQCVWMQV